MTDLSNKHVWLNPPFRHANAFVQHYLALKAKSPASTSACILVPRWEDPAPLSGVLHGMQVLHSYPKGYPLFRNPSETRTLPGIPWPVDVYYDPPYTPLRAAKAQGDSRMMFCFRSGVHGSSAIVGMDSGATASFVDSRFVEQNGIPTQPIHRMVELANGTTAQISAQCDVWTRIKGIRNGAYQGKVRCYVVDLGGDLDMILGQDWLLRERAELSYHTKRVTLQKCGVVLKPLYKSPLASGPPLLSAMAMRRELRRAEKWFVINVVDDKASGFVPQAESPPPNTSPAPANAPGPPSFEVPASVSPEVGQILTEFSSVFGKRSGLPPDRGIAHLIPEEPDAKPRFKHPYRLSPLEEAEAEKQIKELLQQGLIEPSSSPYGAPILFVQKKDGGLRMCCDWRQLNSQTVKSRFPLPRIDHLLDQLHGATTFSTLDLQAGYNQILINPEDVPKTAFTTPFGHYQWRVLAFGLCNAPATFQSVMNRVFQPLLGKGVLVYDDLDDILVYAKSKEEHAVLLRKVLEILKTNDFYVKLSKCEFERPELKYLGHIVGADGIKVDPAKTRTVQEWPKPATPKDVRAFLGLAGYFRKFVKGFSTMAAPLTHLTRQGVSFDWSDKCQLAFDRVKTALTSAPVLAMPDPSEPYEVRCDASIVGVGAVLMQNGKPLAFESKKHTDAQVKWTTTEQELWAVVHALRVWRCYLEGVHFTVVTDHNPLVHLQTQPNLSRKQARWVEELQRFDFTWTCISRVHPMWLTRCRASLMGARLSWHRFRKWRDPLCYVPSVFLS